jgi:hypothetical protein
MANEVNENVSISQFETSAQNRETVKEDKLVPQSEVNDIVGSVRSKAYQKGYAEAEQAYQSKLANEARQKDVAPMQSSHGLSADDVRRITNEHMRELQAEQQKLHEEAIQREYTQRVCNELAPKIASASTKYSDFEEVMREADFMGETSDMLDLVNCVDNSGEVLYELGQHPSKIGALRNLSQRLKEIEIRKISKSIKRNEEAASQGKTPAPLSQIKSTNIGSSDGDLSVKQLRSKYRA